MNVSKTPQGTWITISASGTINNVSLQGQQQQPQKAQVPGQAGQQGASEPQMLRIQQMPQPNPQPPLPMGQTQMTPVLLGQQGPPFSQPGQMGFQGAAPPGSTPFHQPETYTPAALREPAMQQPAPGVQLPQQPQPPPGSQHPGMMVGPGAPQGPPVGVALPGVPHHPWVNPPKPPTPSDTSSDQRNQVHLCQKKKNFPAKKMCISPFDKERTLGCLRVFFKKKIPNWREF